MFVWFTTHLDGSIIDYLEEYIEQIIIEEFKEREYKQDKLTFIEQMIEKSNSKDSDWRRSYGVGKRALRYLELLSEDAKSEQKCIDFCKKYWRNSSVRRYYIELCMCKKDYENAIRVLDESWFDERCTENRDDEEQKIFAKNIVLSHIPVFDNFKVKKF